MVSDTSDADVDSRKKQLYISKLKQLSKELASPPSSNATTPTASPQRSYNVPATEECPRSSVPESNGNNCEKQKEQRQMRAFNKLKTLISKMESESLKSSPAKTLPSTTNSPTKILPSTTNCITPDSANTRPRSTTGVLGSPNGQKDETSSFNLKGLLQCCGEMNAQDMFSEDDDIEVLMERELDDTTLLDDWSVDILSAPSGGSKRDMNTIDATYNMGSSEFFRGEPYEI